MPCATTQPEKYIWKLLLEKWRTLTSVNVHATSIQSAKALLSIAAGGVVTSARCVPSQGRREGLHLYESRAVDFLPNAPKDFKDHATSPQCHTHTHTTVLSH